MEQFDPIPNMEITGETGEVVGFEEITEALEAATVGSKKIELTFKESPKGIKALEFLPGAATAHMIEYDDALIDFSRYGSPNRKVTITLTEECNHERFANRLRGALEKIEVII